MEYGITRYHITDRVQGPGANRFEWAEMRQPQADLIYRMVFDRTGVPLLPGIQHIDVSKADWEAGYDRFFGVDTHLKTVLNQPFTLQEKFLGKDYHALTVEYFQDHQKGITGDWFNLRAQIYFCGYDRHNRGEFDEWMLVNWPALQMAITRYRINFIVKQNGSDNARASLACIDFRQVPNEVIIAVKHYGGGMQFRHDWVRQMSLL